MYKFYVDGGKILKAVADYDTPEISKDRKMIFMNEDLDYKVTLYKLQNKRIYKQDVIFNDDNTVVKTRLVYSL